MFKKVVQVVSCICLLFLLGIFAYKMYPRDNIVVNQSKDELVLKINSKEDQERVKKLFKGVVYIVWSEFDELPEEIEYDKKTSYEGMSYGVSYFGGENENLLTISSYYDGVYISNYYLKYEYNNGILSIKYIDNENNFTNSEVKDIIMGYLQSKEIEK